MNAGCEGVGNDGFEHNVIRTCFSVVMLWRGATCCSPKCWEKYLAIGIDVSIFVLNGSWILKIVISHNLPAENIADYGIGDTRIPGGPK